MTATQIGTFTQKTMNMKTISLRKQLQWRSPIVCRSVIIASTPSPISRIIILSLSKIKERISMIFLENNPSNSNNLPIKS